MPPGPPFRSRPDVARADPRPSSDAGRATVSDREPERYGQRQGPPVRPSIGRAPSGPTSSAAGLWRGPGTVPIEKEARHPRRTPQSRGRSAASRSTRTGRPGQSRRIPMPGGANHGRARHHGAGGRTCRIAENPFLCRQLGRVKVPVFHSRRAPVSSDRHFFSNGVLTGRKGLAYNPPIDAAPRFTGSTPRPLNFSP